jgi:predicted transcriptional regulator
VAVRKSKTGRGNKTATADVVFFPQTTIAAYRKLAKHKDRIEEYASSIDDVPTQGQHLDPIEWGWRLRNYWPNVEWRGKGGDRKSKATVALDSIAQVAAELGVPERTAKHRMSHLDPIEWGWRLRNYWPNVEWRGSRGQSKIVQQLHYLAAELGVPERTAKHRMSQADKLEALPKKTQDDIRNRKTSITKGKRNELTSATIAEVAEELGVAKRTAEHRMSQADKLEELPKVTPPTERGRGNKNSAPDALFFDKHAIATYRKLAKHKDRTR